MTAAPKARSHGLAGAGAGAALSTLAGRSAALAVNESAAIAKAATNVFFIVSPCFLSTDPLPTPPPPPPQSGPGPRRDVSQRRNTHLTACTLKWNRLAVAAFLSI